MKINNIPFGDLTSVNGLQGSGMSKICGVTATGGSANPIIDAGVLALYDIVSEVEEYGYQDEDEITTWHDISGNGFDMEALLFFSGAEAPRYKVDGLNIDNPNATGGVYGFATPWSGNIPGINPRNKETVYRNLDLCPILEVSKDSTCFVVCDSYDTYLSGPIVNAGGNLWGAYHPNSNVWTTIWGTNQYHTASDISTGTGRVFMFERDHSALETRIWRDNILRITSTDSNVSHTSYSGTGVFNIGGHEGGGSYTSYGGAISHVCVFDKLLTAQERTDIYDYLTTRYNL
jgi:hypothetical protein